MQKNERACTVSGKAHPAMQINWKKCVISGILGFAVTVGVCMLFSWLMCSGAVSEHAAGFMAYTALLAGGVAAAWLAAGKTRKMLEALPACGVLLLMLVLCGLVFFGGMRITAFLGAALVLAVAAFCGSALSGLRK
jgi:hypothetical protein